MPKDLSAAEERTIVPIETFPGGGGESVSLATDRELWERQPGEGNKSWVSFCAYRDMPPGERSMAAAFRIYVERPTARQANDNWWALRKQWHWAERVVAYDRHMDDLYRKELEARRIQARVETADLGQAMRQKAMEAVAELKAITTTVRKVDGKRVRVVRSSLSPGQIAQLAKVGVKLERLALGEDSGRGPTAAVQVNVVTDGRLVEQAEEIIDARKESAIDIDQL